MEHMLAVQLLNLVFHREVIQTYAAALSSTSTAFSKCEGGHVLAGYTEGRDAVNLLSRKTPLSLNQPLFDTAPSRSLIERLEINGSPEVSIQAIHIDSLDRVIEADRPMLLVNP